MVMESGLLSIVMIHNYWNINLNSVLFMTLLEEIAKQNGNIKGIINIGNIIY